MQGAPTSQCPVCGAAITEDLAEHRRDGEDYLCPHCGSGSSTPSRLLNALARLNEVGSTINRIGPGDTASISTTLRLIVESAVEVVPGASAVIYTYNDLTDNFEPGSRVAAGERRLPSAPVSPRPNGMGRRAISLRRRVISYEAPNLAIHHLKAKAGAQAVVCFPLMVADGVVGVLYVYLHEQRQFSQLELLMLDNFVNQAAMAIFHARQVASVQRDLSRKEDELARLSRAGLLISSRPRLEDTLAAIIEMALEMTNAQYGVFRLVDQTDSRLDVAAYAGDALSQPLMKTLPIDTTSVTGWAARHRQTLLIRDLSEEPWASVYRPLDDAVQMRSELVVPLLGASGRLEGILNLESPEPGAFSEQDSHLLQALATQAVIAIQEIRLLNALQEVARRLVVEPHDEVLKHLTELACSLLNAAVSAIWILEGETLVLSATSSDHEHGQRVPLHSSLIGKAVQRRESIVSNDVRTDPLFHRSDLARAQGWTQALVVPLLAAVDQHPVGVIAVYSDDSERGRFTESEWDKKVLTVLAHYAVLALQTEARQQALRAAEEQRTIAETFAVMGDIAANLLHELNNKVGIIPVRVQGILAKSKAVLEADPYLMANVVEIEKSATEAMSAVRHNLTLLRPITLAPLEVSHCIDAAITSAPLPSGVRVKVDCPDDLPDVLASEQSLRLVFVNLLENAASAMNSEGLIIIQAKAGMDWVEIAISDTGSGISPELQARIFEFNLSGHAQPSADRLGFGLWWVKTLMTRLGGSVTLESKVGQGSTFRLSLPPAQDGSSANEGR